MTENEKLKLIFYGQKEDMNKTQNIVYRYISDTKFVISWKSRYPNVVYKDVIKILEDQDLDQKKGEWLRDMRFSSIRGALQQSEGTKPTLGGWGVELEPREFGEWRDIAKDISLPASVQFDIAEVSPDKRPPGNAEKTTYQNAPFSYDPNQDYSTDPSSW